jgi:polar amino acid transport system ATP-binding protein
LVLEKVHNKSIQEAEKITIDLFRKFGLEEHKDKKPHQLSGGQKQRIAIVRALAIDSEILMLDEPTAALDPILTSEVLEMIGTLKKERKDFIIVTHEMGFARSVADYILFVDKGKIVEYGVSKELFEKPKTEELKNFFGKILEWKM